MKAGRDREWVKTIDFSQTTGSFPVVSYDLNYLRSHFEFVPFSYFILTKLSFTPILQKQHFLFVLIWVIPILLLFYQEVRMGNEIQIFKKSLGNPSIHPSMLCLLWLYCRETHPSLPLSTLYPAPPVGTQLRCSLDFTPLP